MTDAPDRLRQALATAPPPKADATAQADAQAAALAAFDAAEENAPAAQGSTAGARPRARHSRLATLWRRAMTFTLPSTRTLMLGGTSLAVLALALVITTNLAEQGPLDLGTSEGTIEPAPVAQDAQTAAAPDSEAGAGLVQLRDRQASPQRPALAEAEAPMAQAEIAAPPAPAPTQARPAPVARGAIVGGQHLGAERPGQPGYQDQGRDRFEEIETNPVKVTAEDPVSTFSIDVDTASYAFVRRQLMAGVLPQKDAVRVEEMINYFPYDYAAPDSAETPFQPHVALMETPWNPQTRLLRVALQGYDLAPAEKPRSNLVFLLDTSGSMNAPDKLPLLINAFRMLVDSLDDDDTVAIVTYAGSAGTVLEPTPAAERAKILAALERLQAGGSTAGGEGIRQAYALAEANLDPDGVNRVFLATDGDFNVGITSADELQDFVERKRQSGIFLSVLGFGQGNYNDRLMQALAQNGNGQAAYIDTLNEARKTLVEEASSALFPIAKDVKIQIEFNPAAVAEYRLIGYETRLLAREDFNNDQVDAGEIGSGHAVTALYEITPVGGATRVDPLRYGEPRTADGPADELAFLKIRYKAPEADTSQLIERPITEADAGAPDSDARFAAAVAAFGQLLRDGKYLGDFGYADVLALANGAKGADPFGYRAEFVNLVRLAESAAALPRP